MTLMDKKPLCQREYMDTNRVEQLMAVCVYTPFLCEANRPQQLLILMILQMQVQICAVAHSGAKLNEPL